MNETITEFLHHRKEEWLKKRIKKGMSEEEKNRILSEADDKFDSANWLAKAAKSAGQMAITTHPAKFSHPSIGKDASLGICDAVYVPDGLLRSGNVTNISIDGFGNAAALPVYEFLTLKLADGKMVIEHIRKETEEGRDVVEMAGGEYRTVRDGFLKILGEGKAGKSTSSRIKQVYFPVGEDSYHLLSILTPSGIVHRLKRRIDELRFGEEIKAARDDRKEGRCEENRSYLDLYDLAILKYGGTKPQNISVLNNELGGRSYLFLSIPPPLDRRKVRIPKRDFFLESLPKNETDEIFEALCKITETDYNNIAIREGRRHRYRLLVELIVERLWQIRAVWSEQYFEEGSRLPFWQKTWLGDDDKKKQEGDEWLDEVKNAIARYVIDRIERSSKKKLTLGKEEFDDMMKIIDEYEEALR